SEGQREKRAVVDLLSFDSENELIADGVGKVSLLVGADATVVVHKEDGLVQKNTSPGEIRVMGNCAPVSSAKGGQQQWLRTAKVIRADGKMEEYETAVPAGHVVARSPGYYVCSGEAMQVGARPPVVGEGEQLQPGQLYFLLPLSYSRRPLSLPDLCLFAAKASAALRQPSSLACNAHAVRGHQFCVSSSLIEQQQKPFLA
ncbi:hypothetical protein B296_00024698, partial [Ensete ventricosum]